jgi:4-carboxymuconolactone decarboxylase
MEEDLRAKTAATAKLYFEGFRDEIPFNLWRSFDKELAKDLSLFITGKMYARERIPHTTRQLISVAALTVLERREELKLHLYAALNVGCDPKEVAEVMNRLLDYVQEQWDDIPENAKTEVNFRDLENDPEGTVEKIYMKLKITPAPGFKEKLKLKLDETRSYKKNRYIITEQEKEIIKKTLGKHFIYYHYQA